MIKHKALSKQVENVQKEINIVDHKSLLVQILALPKV